MKNRRTQLSQEFVGGLNLIEVEFFQEGGVIDAYKGLIQSFEVAWPQTENDQRILVEKRAKLIGNLLHAIARVLKIPVHDIEFYQGGYSPLWWQKLEADQTKLRDLLIEVLEQKRGFPVSPFGKDTK